MTTVVLAVVGAIVGLAGVGVGCRRRYRSPVRVIAEVSGSRVSRGANAGFKSTAPSRAGSKSSVLWDDRIGSTTLGDRGNSARPAAGQEREPGALEPGALGPGVLRPGALGQRAWRGVETRWARTAAEYLAERSVLAEAIEPALHLTEMSWPQLGGQVVAGACAGLATGLAIVALDVVVSGFEAVVAGIVVVLATGVGAGAPIVAVRRRGERQRLAASKSVASYLDLVVLCLAGGMGVESALQQAAAIAEDPFSQRIATTVAAAGHGGRPPWQSLAEMGETIGLAELVELANAIALAGTEGARVRSTLGAKADTLRRRQLAMVEAQANAVTERLFLPGALVLVGFLVFIGYPALARIMSGL